MRRLALIPLLALAAAACEELPTGPSDGRPVSDIQFSTTSSSAGAMLLGTTRGSPSAPITLSTLVEIDPATGETVRTIGPVGYAVNGLEYDATTGTLYGSTTVWDPNHNGLIEIDPSTGAGTPIGVNGWGLTGGLTAVTNITVNSKGQMFGWWDPDEDDLVSIDKATGVATRVGDFGFWTATYGLDFDNADVLYLVNVGGNVYTVDPTTGAGTYTGSIETIAHHGDFDPSSNLYYGISGFPRSGSEELVAADLSTREVIESFDGISPDIHAITFIQTAKAPEVPLSVDVDIKPGSCRNPVNVRSRGVLPMAILGTDEFDVTQVDPASLMLEGVSPIRWRVRDVAMRNQGDSDDGCSIERRDRRDDLVLWFRSQAIVAALRDDDDDDNDEIYDNDDDDLEDGAVLPLTLTGKLMEEFGGSAIEGQDDVEILNRGRRRPREWIRHVWKWIRSRGSS
jgi:hypothetical protein